MGNRNTCRDTAKYLADNAFGSSAAGSNRKVIMGIFSFIFGKRPEPEKERGTVVFQSPEQKVAEVGGITLTSSIFIKKFTEEETRENAKGNRWFYEPAYKQVTQTLEADPKQISAMFDELIVAFTAGSPRKEYDVVKQFLPEGTWRWPAYEDFAQKRDQECYDEDLEFWTKATLSDLITSLKVGQLRCLYKEFAGDKAKSPGRKKAEIANALFDVLTADQKSALAERLRGEAIAGLELPGTPDYKEMVELLCRRISMIAYGISCKSQMKESSDMFPTWEFAILERPGMPKECRKRHGKRYRHDDPIWDTLPPCNDLECGCRVVSISKFK